MHGYIITTIITFNAVGKAAVVTRRDSSMLLYPRAFEVKLSLPAYAPIRVQRLGRRIMSSFLPIVLERKMFL